MFELSAELEADFALWLSTYAGLLHKHQEEISKILPDWRNYARRKFTLVQPRQRAGRLPDENVTRALKLRSEGKSWQQIYVITEINADVDAQERLRDAVRARRVRRRTQKADT